MKKKLLTALASSLTGLLIVPQSATAHMSGPEPELTVVDDTTAPEGGMTTERTATQLAAIMQLRATLASAVGTEVQSTWSSSRVDLVERTRTDLANRLTDLEPLQGAVGQDLAFLAEPASPQGGAESSAQLGLSTALSQALQTP